MSHRTFGVIHTVAYFMMTVIIYAIIFYFKNAGVEMNERELVFVFFIASLPLLAGCIPSAIITVKHW